MGNVSGVGNFMNKETEKRNKFADFCIVGTLENKTDVIAINLKNVEYVTYLDDKRSQFHFVSGNSVVLLRETIITSDGHTRKQINC